METPLLDGLLPLGVTVVALSFIPTWILIFLTLFLVLFCYQKWTFGTLQDARIPGPVPFPIFGTLLPVIMKGVRQTDVDLIRKYGKVVRTWEGSTPAIIIVDPDMLKEVCIKQFHCFKNRRSTGFDEYPIRKSLTRLKDAKWKHVRSLLNPSFTTAKLRQIVDQINECSDSLIDRLLLKADQGELIDFKHLSSEFAVEVIARTAFRMNPHDRPGGIAQFMHHAEKTFSFNWYKSVISLLLLFPFSHWIMKYLHVKLFPPASSDFFLNVIGEALEKHIINDERQPSLLQSMLDVLDNNHNVDEKGLIPEEIEAQCLLIFLAGYETTASTLAFLAYCLAINPECQKKLVNEIDETLEHSSEVSMEKLSEMPYLDMCLSETLRMYPPVVRVNRVCSSTVQIGSVQILKGSVVIIPIYAIHHLPNLWSNPEKFDPNRFTVQARSSRKPMSYLPFGAGPRHCLGSKLSILEIKTAIVYLLRKCTIKPSPETQVPLKLKPGALLKAEKGVILKLVRRS